MDVVSSCFNRSLNIAVGGFLVVAGLACGSYANRLFSDSPFIAAFLTCLAIAPACFYMEKLSPKGCATGYIFVTLCVTIFGATAFWVLAATLLFEQAFIGFIGNERVAQGVVLVVAFGAGSYVGFFLVNLIGRKSLNRSSES